MREAFYEHLQRETDGVKEAGLFKNERVITSPQRAVIDVAGGKPVINLCANNYLGLAADAEVVKAAHKALMSMAMAWPRCASSASPKTCT